MSGWLCMCACENFCACEIVLHLSEIYQINWRGRLVSFDSLEISHGCKKFNWFLWNFEIKQQQQQHRQNSKKKKKSIRIQIDEIIGLWTPADLTLGRFRKELIAPTGAWVHFFFTFFFFYYNNRNRLESLSIDVCLRNAI